MREHVQFLWPWQRHKRRDCRWSLERVSRSEPKMTSRSRILSSTLFIRCLSRKLRTRSGSGECGSSALWTWANVTRSDYSSIRDQSETKVARIIPDLSVLAQVLLCIASSYLARSKLILREAQRHSIPSRCVSPDWWLLLNSVSQGLKELLERRSFCHYCAGTVGRQLFAWSTRDHNQDTIRAVFRVDSEQHSESCRQVLCYVSIIAHRRWEASYPTSRRLGFQGRQTQYCQTWKAGFQHRRTPRFGNGMGEQSPRWRGKSRT